MSKHVIALNHDHRGLRSTGFTLIELMIVIAIIAIILTLALPVYSNYTIRAKIGEALSVAAAAKTAVGVTCVDDPTIGALTPALAGYGFTGSPYVESIDVSGPCSQPFITIVTRGTGAETDPTLTLTGQFTDASKVITWQCATDGEIWHVPSTCRS